MGTYGNGDGLDSSHTGPNTCKKESPKKNRTRPRRGKKYALNDSSASLTLITTLQSNNHDIL